MKTLSLTKKKMVMALFGVVAASVLSSCASPELRRSFHDLGTRTADEARTVRVIHDPSGKVRGWQVLGIPIVRAEEPPSQFRTGLFRKSFSVRSGKPGASGKISFD